MNEKKTKTYFLAIDRRSIYFHDEQGKLYELQKVTGPGRKSAWLIDNIIHKGKYFFVYLFYKLNLNH